jgi:putative ABC transport system substrate-binding protein
MRRRDFLGFLGGAAIAIGWPVAAPAQRRVRRIGVLTLLSQDKDRRIEAFTSGMRDLGYIAGQNITFDYRYAEGDNKRLEPLALDLLKLSPNVIFAGEPSGARAVKKAAVDLPIVCPVLTDRLPDLFTTYARPGGSVTGIASSVENMNSKLVELVLDVMPGTTRLGLLVNPDGANREFVTQQTVEATRSRGMTTHIEQARTPGELEPAFNRFTEAGVQAVVVPPNGMFINQRRTIVRLLVTARLPSFFWQRQDVEAGGFMSYGVNETEGSRRAAIFVDKILKGAKPGDLPIEFPTEIQLVINLDTAKALNITVSREMQLRANEVIE